MHKALYHIKQTFTVTPSGTELAERVMAAIDAVHGISSLTGLTFDRADLPSGWQGQFDPYTRTVTVSAEAQFPLTSGVHEIGHGLDAIFLVNASGLGRLEGPITRYASDYGAGFSRGLLLDWFDVAMKSRPIRDIRTARHHVRFGSDDYEAAQYYLDPKEIWARSYEQFVAQKTNDIALRSEFRSKRTNRENIAGNHIRVYWTHEEFAPMSRVIELMFRTIGWM